MCSRCGMWGSVVAVMMEVPESMLTWRPSAQWTCSRQPRLGSSRWDHLSQVGMIEFDVENIKRALHLQIMMTAVTDE